MLTEGVTTPHDCTHIVISVKSVEYTPLILFTLNHFLMNACDFNTNASPL